MLNLEAQSTQPLSKLAGQTRIKSLMNSRNKPHIPTIQYVADRKKCFQDIDCIENRIEVGIEDYREGTEETDFPKFLTETKIQQNKYEWKGPKQLESNLDNLYLSIGNGLSKLIQIFSPSLATLKITIRASYWTEFQDKDMEHLSLQIARHLPQLKEFSIKIVDCDTFTDEGVKALVENLTQNCFNLETLELSFPCCSLLSDESFKSLLYDLSRHLKKLKNIEISVAECRKMTKQTLEYIRKDLRVCKFQSLESLSFNFDLCYEMLGIGCFDELEDDVLKYLPNLKSFYRK